MKKVIIAGLLLVVSRAGVAAETEQWQFNLTPYFWFPGVDGEVTAVAGLPADEFK